MKVRNATTKDLKQYTDLLQQTYEIAYTNEAIGLTSDLFSKEIFASKESQDYLKSHLEETDTQKTWLTFNSNKLIGSITCIINNNTEAELTGFYVLPRYQGQGLGKKMYELALEFAGNRDMLLDVYCHNTTTIEMYKKWGWSRDTSRGDKGYFYRHWSEWPEGIKAKCVYMCLKRNLRRVQI